MRHTHTITCTCACTWTHASTHTCTCARRPRSDPRLNLKTPTKKRDRKIQAKKRSACPDVPPLQWPLAVTRTVSSSPFAAAYRIILEQIDTILARHGSFQHRFGALRVARQGGAHYWCTFVFFPNSSQNIPFTFVISHAGAFFPIGHFTMTSHTGPVRHLTIPC